MAELVQAGHWEFTWGGVQGPQFFSAWTSPHGCLSFCTKQKLDSKGVAQKDKSQNARAKQASTHISLVGVSIANIRHMAKLRDSERGDSIGTRASGNMDHWEGPEEELLTAISESVWTKYRLNIQHLKLII